MDSVLPDSSGLSINGVYYTYTPIKETSADLVVDVGNWNANKSDYIWKETDDWSGKPGGVSIIKTIGLPYTNRSLWGDGFIDVTKGEGEITDASVVYSYKVDPCYNPQYDPNCPGYLPPKIEEASIVIYDATTDKNVVIEQIDVAEVYEEEKTKEEIDEEEEEERRKLRLEKALSAVDNSALFAEGIAQAQMLQQMNNLVNVNNYLNKNIDGGNYQEKVVLDGGDIPDNKSGRRMNFTTQKLHNEMIDAQYNTE